MSKYKRFLSMVLILSICFSANIKALASNTVDDVSMKIIEALRNIEFMKEDMGLADVDFEDIMVSNPIHAYDYTNDGMIESNILYYPLMIDGELIAWAIANESDEAVFYQITRWFVDEINTIVSNNTQFALVFDYDSCYLYDGTEMHLLKSSLDPVTERKMLPSSKKIILQSNIQLNSIDHSELLGYSMSIATRALTIRTLNIKHVTQQPYENICWAASIACIRNYLRNENLTADAVAKKYYGNSAYNRILMKGDEVYILNNIYGLSYTYKNQTSSAENILYNIQNGYPVYGGFTSTFSHAVVIYGINTSNNVIYIMDPWERTSATGLVTGSYVTNKGYQYTGPNNRTLTFSWATCRSWILGG